MDNKRVWCLYRVSTKKQVTADEDIPMQRNACHEFVKQKHGWVVENELYEKGVSGWKKKVDDRDALNEIKEAAIKKEFDVLLVFMLDRLGRREDETPLVVNFLYENGIEVWSVQEGKRSVESHVDKLITYIGFWQSSGESLKTSMRVREAKKQLSEEGYYQGGPAPYGYKVIDTDIRHWKYRNRFIKELVPDEYESKVVIQMFDWYVNSYCGYRKIADKLNEAGYRSRDGRPFRVNTIQRALINPIVIGLKNHKNHGSDCATQPYNEKLRIISDDLFYKAEEIRTKRKGALTEQNKEGIPLSGKLLFSGLAYCSYCGAKLSGNYLYRVNKIKNANKDYEYTNIVYRYRCPLNKGNRAEHHEKNIWGAKKFDKIALEVIKTMMSVLDLENFINTNVEKKNSVIQHKKSTLLLIEKEREKLTKQLSKLNSEIANSLIGESHFTPEQLSAAIDLIKKQISELNNKIKIISEEISRKQDNFFEENKLAEELKNWEEKFDKADDDLKKAMLSRIIKSVEFKKDDVVVNFNIGGISKEAN